MRKHALMSSYLYIVLNDLSHLIPIWFVVWIFNIKSHFALFIYIKYIFSSCCVAVVFTVTCFFFFSFYRKVLGLAAATSNCFHHVGNKRGSQAAQIGLEWQSPSRLNSQWVTMPATIYQSSFVRSRTVSHLPLYLDSSRKKNKNTTDQTNQLGLAKRKPDRHLWHQAS